jgi:hypothetical protein
MRVASWPRTTLLSILILLSLSAFVQVEGDYEPQLQHGEWSEPVNLSNTPTSSRFPDLAVDSRGDVHVVWCESTPVEGRGVSEQILYTRWDGQEWLSPNDLLAPQFFIYRNAIAIGPNGDMFMAYRKGMHSGYGIMFSSAPASVAWSAAAWSSPRMVSARSHNYATDLAVDDQGVLHLVFDDFGETTDEVCIGGCADIYYRRSEDFGQTWSTPRNLSRSPVGSSREQLEIDASGAIHLTWDDGWDRLTGTGTPHYSAYTASYDGGLSWSEPLTITYPLSGTLPLTTTTAMSGTAQLVAGADGKGGVMLVWRNTAYWEVFYQWSTDYGKTWSAPGTIAGVLARHWTSPFDQYDVAADSAGNIHLVVVGGQTPKWNAPLAVYHSVWNGDTWSDPVQISGPGGPEYVNLIVGEGNHLHAAWGVLDEVIEGFSHYDVWYSDSYSDAPAQTPVPVTPTAVPLPSPTAATPTLAPSPYPTVPSGPSGLPSGLYTENDEVLRVVLSVSPVLLIIVLVVVLRRARRR